MNYIEEMKKLRNNYDCQCIENGKKQDQIYELKRKIREMEEELNKLKEENKLLKEVCNDRKHNTRK